MKCNASRPLLLRTIAWVRGTDTDRDRHPLRRSDQAPYRSDALADDGCHRWLPTILCMAGRGDQTCTMVQAQLLRPRLPGALECSLDRFCRIEEGLRGTLLRRIAPTVVALAKRRLRHIHRPPLALHPCPAPQGTDLSLQAQLLEHGPKLRHPCLPLSLYVQTTMSHTQSCGSGVPCGWRARTCPTTGQGVEREPPSPPSMTGR